MSNQWWANQKGSFESRAKQMAKQVLGDKGSRLTSFDDDSEQNQVERTPFKNRVESLFSAISVPAKTNPLVPLPLEDICPDEKSSSMPWVVADFPEDVTALKRNADGKDSGMGSEGESADDALDDDEIDPRKQGLSNKIEVLDSNPYEQKCIHSGNSRNKQDRRVRITEPVEVCPPVDRSVANVGRQAKNERPCFSFSQTGKCRFGAGCAFRHTVSDFVANPDKYTKYDISWDDEEDTGDALLLDPASIAPLTPQTA